MRRGAIPDVLQTAPELQEGLDLFWDAFGVLSTTRQLGQGFIGPIPWDKIMEYCDRRELEEEQVERMLDYLRAMDSVFQAHVNTKAKATWLAPSPPKPPAS